MSGSFIKYSLSIKKKKNEKPCRLRLHSHFPKLGPRVSIFSKNHVPPKCHLSQSASFAKIQEFPQSIFGKLLSINDLGLFLGVYTSERTQ